MGLGRIVRVVIGSGRLAIYAARLSPMSIGFYRTVASYARSAIRQPSMPRLKRLPCTMR
jgi:hypothetical protein